jgi:glycine/D-amino acid oxidase-like deaminating enzyme
MTTFSPFDQTLWHATAKPAPVTSELIGEVHTDVCVVGGGYTGLTTAIELRKRGHDVVLLEAQEAGFGGSGRNAGHCTPTFSYLTITDLRKRLGTERAGRLIKRQTMGADMAADFIEKYQIECEWVQNGYLQGALYPSRMTALAKKAESYAAVGSPSTMIDADEAYRLTGTTRFQGGWLLRSGGHLNPLGYARGLARAAIQEGVRLYTQSPMQKAARTGSAWRLSTDKGSIVCDKFIMATGAYTVGADGLGIENTYRIMRPIVAATNPMPDHVRRKVLPYNGTVHDGRGDLYAWKYNHEGRIVATMVSLGRRGPDVEYTKTLLMERLRWFYPEIPQSTRWDFFWRGELDMQPQTIPRLYALGAGALACTGLSGRGVPTGTMLGGILADWAEDKPDKDLALPVERLSKAPAYMSFGPTLRLYWDRVRDGVASLIDRSELPPRP